MSSTIHNMSSSQLREGPSNDILTHVVDIHCHPTDSMITDSSMDSLPIKICAMATRESDQPLVRDLALRWPEKVTPCFGYHPWFTHWISLEPSVSKEQHYRALLLDTSRQKDKVAEDFERLLKDLPEPILLSDILASLRANLTHFPNAMLGEVGLDRSFCIPFPQPPGKNKVLSPFTVPLDHQMHILEAQLQLAIELKRNVSMHSVKVQKATLQLIDRMSNKFGDEWDMISLDIHSCGLSPEMWTSLEKNHPNIYLSLSTVINARSSSHRALLAACDPHRILAESDYHDIHGTTERTWDMIKIIADVKGWEIEKEWTPAETKEENWGAVRRLEENWKKFSQGNHVEKRRQLDIKKRNRKTRKDVYWNDESD